MRCPFVRPTACLAMGIQEGVLHIDWPDCSQCGSPGNADCGGGAAAAAAGPAVRLHDILLALSNNPAAAAAGPAHDQAGAAAAGPYCGPGTGTTAETANNACMVTNHSRTATPGPKDDGAAADNDASDAATAAATQNAAACPAAAPAPPPVSACGNGASTTTTTRTTPAATAITATTPAGMTSAGMAGNAQYPDDAATGRMATRALVALGRMCTREDPEARPCMAEVLGELLDIEQMLRRGMLSGPGGSLGTGAAVSRASTGVTCAMEGRGSVDGAGAGAGVAAGGLCSPAGVR